MNGPDLYLLCLSIGVLWSVATLLLGSFHFGHGGFGHGGHGHSGHLHSGPAHAPHLHANGASPKGALRQGTWTSGMLNPSCAAVFLAWFGGVGYLLTRHSGLGFWINLALACALGLAGAWLLAAFLQFLQSREQPLNPADYQMLGVLGEVSSVIRPDGVGEVIYVRDGARKLVPAKSEDHKQIERGEEVIVTGYDQGVAYVRTWAAMTQSRFSPESSSQGSSSPESIQKEAEHAE